MPNRTSSRTPSYSQLQVFQSSVESKQNKNLWGGVVFLEMFVSKTREMGPKGLYSNAFNGCLGIFFQFKTLSKGRGQWWHSKCGCKQELHRHDASRSLFMFFSKYRILYVLWCTPMHKAMYSASKPTFPPFKRLSKQSSQNSHPPFGLNKELEECEGLYYDPFCHTQPICTLQKFAAQVLPDYGQYCLRVWFSQWANLAKSF